MCNQSLLEIRLKLKLWYGSFADTQMCACRRIGASDANERSGQVCEVCGEIGSDIG
jgi:hypothetical protein